MHRRDDDRSQLCMDRILGLSREMDVAGRIQRAISVQDAVLLVMANKQDLPNAMSTQVGSKNL